MVKVTTSYEKNSYYDSNNDSAVSFYLVLCAKSSISLVMILETSILWIGCQHTKRAIKGVVIVTLDGVMEDSWSH